MRSLRRFVTPPVVLAVGAALVIAGLALIALGWSKIAALHDVSLQMPYLASACFTGVGVAMCGIALAVMGARERDALLEDRRLEELAALLSEIADSVGRDR